MGSEKTQEGPSTCPRLSPLLAVQLQLDCGAAIWKTKRKDGDDPFARPFSSFFRFSCPACLGVAVLCSVGSARMGLKGLCVCVCRVGGRERGSNNVERQKRSVDIAAFCYLWGKEEAEADARHARGGSAKGKGARQCTVRCAPDDTAPRWMRGEGEARLSANTAATRRRPVEAG